MSVAAIIVAAGRGSRAGGGIPKQFRPLAGRSALNRVLEVFLSHPAVDRVQAVVDPSDREHVETALAGLPSESTRLAAPPVPGGATRQASVRQGLEALAREQPAPALVLVHDAARPFPSLSLIDRAIAAGRAHGAAVPGLAVTDTIKLVDRDGLVRETPPRDALRAIQTPQAFAFAALLGAHRAAAKAGLDTFTDDGALAEWAGLPVTVFAGDPDNIKLTRESDFAEAERRIGGGAPVHVTRVGTGFDVHAFAPGDHVWLGGLRVAYERGVLAHSDGDVVLHALTDALLGALGDGDIGVYFPPSDAQWRGVSSDRFLASAVERVRARGGVIDHLDVTVLCEAPRVGPHRDAMRARIAEIAAIGRDAVSIKATTTEKLGFIGRGEGLAAQAVATIRLPTGRS
ncbi:MAG TPA: bifunctional 2-C-methyl-D-erythritol 4-phosphate cytidylyltransferase/2-C-methyl-D-erythritol 2,4-cyclodiphosphate synthase [Beijerinckiaceae bacterium]|nr:bifunctional 2-C-methyl-D-erythritol 4-phosphate cytidylyltransferase/2-C-methyl-D-erythritol 2,4-cyclodiphosphate synthase [Beijerinckiaceae bacterium]